MSDRWDVPIPAELAIPPGEVLPPDDEMVDLYLASRTQAGGGVPTGTDVAGTVERVAAFRLDNDDHAEYYLRKLAATGRELTTMRERAEAWKASIDAWLAQQSGAIDRRRLWWVAHLEDYAVRRRERMLAEDPKDPRAKTLALPSGKVSTSHHRPTPKIVDEEAVVAWLDERCRARNLDPVALGWIKVKRSPVADKVKGLVTVKGSTEEGYVALVDGKPVPGVAVEESVTATVKEGP